MFSFEAQHWIFVLLEIVKSELKKLSPNLIDTLQEPATVGAINALAEYIGAELPDDFVNLYLDSNGNNPEIHSNFAYGMEFVNIEHCLFIVRRFEKYKQYDMPLLNYVDPGIDISIKYSKLRIPIGDDSGTTNICVDLCPSDSGDYGQVILFDYDLSVALKLASSVSEYIKYFESDLKNGMYVLYEESQKYNEYWLKPCRDIDVVNWHKSSRWDYVPR